MLDKFINCILNDKLVIFFITINYTNNSNLKLNDREHNLNFISKIFINEKFQTSFFYLVPELNKNNNEHYHLVYGYKSLVDFNDSLKINILNELKTDISYDIDLKQINNFINIKEKFKYILKDSYKEIDSNLLDHKFFLEEYLIYKNSDLVAIYSDIDNKIIGILNTFKVNNTNFGSFYIHNSEYSKYTLLLMVKWYCILKNLKYKDGFLFEKIENSWYSYTQYESLSWIKQNILEIYEFLYKKYPINYSFIPVEYLMITEKFNDNEVDLFLLNLKQNKNLKFVFDIIEFNNGFYFFKFNKFFEKEYFIKNNIRLNENFLIIKYYNYNYNRRFLPKNWINHLKNAINDNIDNEKFQLTCAYLANTILKNYDIFEKKKVLYIWGNSSTGKTTIVARVLWKYFGEENIGVLSGSKNFELQNLVNKEVGILDEYKFNKKKRERDLKLFEGQTIIEDVKYKNLMKIKDLSIIALSNYSINPLDANNKEEEKYTDIALSNRTQLINFIKKENIINPINLDLDEIKKLDNEDPYILIYCNKILHNIYIKNKAKSKNRNIIEYFKKTKIIENYKQKKLN